MGHKYASDRKVPHADEVRHAQPEVPPHRSRKDTKRWCRGKPGVEHQLVVRRSKNGWRSDACRYISWWWKDDGWSCQHERGCTACGKTVVYGLGLECPDWKPCES